MAPLRKRHVTTSQRQGLLAYEMEAMEQEDSELRTTGLYAEVHHHLSQVEARRAELITALRAASEVAAV